MSEWFLAHDGNTIGPYSIEQLRTYLGEGRIKLDAMVWRQGMAAWAALSAALPELVNPAPMAASAAPSPTPPASEASAAARARSFSVQSFANRVADLAGVDRLEGFSLRELLSASFRRYRLEEIEAHFAVGNAKDTPALAEIEPGWPKPWMFVRLLAGTAVVFAGFFVMLLFWHNAKLLPALIVVGSFAVPMATLIFFFELNSPRNVSLYLVLRSVLLGGLVSIACALFLFGLTRGVSWVGPPLAGVVEEIAKLATVYALTFHLDAKRYPYVLNGMLFGAAVGTGFAAFESAGYAFEVMLSGLFDPARQGVDVLGGSLNIVVRGLLAPFGHIVWTALVAGALWRVKLDQPLKLGMLFHLRVLRALATVMLLHAIWNTGWLHAPFFLKEWLLGFIAWVLAFSMLQTGLKQIKAAQQSDDAAAPQLSGATAVLRRAGPIGMGSRAK